LSQEQIRQRHHQKSAKVLPRVQTLKWGGLPAASRVFRVHKKGLNAPEKWQGFSKDFYKVAARILEFLEAIKKGEPTQ
jgi:hypothetical protein